MTENELKPKVSDEEAEEEVSDSADERTYGSETDESSGSDSGEEPKLEPPHSGKKSEPPHLSEESDSDSDLPPKKSDVVDYIVQPVTSKPKTKIKRPASAPVEKNAKKAKPNTANGEAKKKAANKNPDLDVSESVDSGSGSETDSDSDSLPKKSVVADPNVKSIFSKLLQSKSAKKVASKPVATSSQANGGTKKGLRLDDISTSESEDLGSSDTETDSESSPKKSVAALPKVKPITSKPMESKLVKETGSKTVATSSLAESKTPAKKGKKDGVTEDKTKKQLFQRLWSEDDEIAILEGMIAFKNERKSDPIADMVAFLDFVKKSLHVDVSKAQLADKIRRLKKKFVNNASREKDSKDTSFLKGHEQKVYELSKSIWGSNSEIESKNKNQSNKNGNSKIKITGNDGVSLVKPNGLDEKDRVMMEVDKKLDVSRFVTYSGMSDSLVLTEEVVKAGMELVDESKRVELEAKWRKLKELELEVYVKRMELLKEQVLVVLEAVRSSGNGGN